MLNMFLVCRVSFWMMYLKPVLQPLTFVSIISYSVVLSNNIQRHFWWVVVRCQWIRAPRIWNEGCNCRKGTNVFTRWCFTNVIFERMGQKWGSKTCEKVFGCFLRGQLSTPWISFLFFFLWQKVFSDCPFLCGGQQFPSCGPQWKYSHYTYSR